MSIMGHYDWDATGYPVFYVHGLAGEDKRDRNKLDAMLVLFEAAQDMLAALKAVEEHHVELNERAGRDEERSWTLRTVRAAIAKAEGRT